MEWVETTGKSVEEAVEAALDQLGVDKADADIEVLDEAKTGLFGRVRSEARVRARVAPVQPRAKDERRDRKPAKSASLATPETSTGSSAVARTRSSKPRSSGTRPSVSTATESAPREFVPREPRSSATLAPESQISEAGIGFLEGLLGAFGLPGTVTSHVIAEGMTEFRVAGADLGVMIGPKAITLTAIQDLLRSIVYYQVDGDAGRILLDVGGYRERRRIALEEFTRKVASEVISSGQARSLEPMSPADRKVIHDTVGTIDGIISLSEGEDAERRVVLSPVS